VRFSVAIDIGGTSTGAMAIPKSNGTICRSAWKLWRV